jgi:hypothetical protein
MLHTTGYVLFLGGLNRIILHIFLPVILNKII